MRKAIIGNSGSGKSTLAQSISLCSGVPCLDLDTLYWEPGPAVAARPISESAAELRAFCENHDSWVIEGCYGDLIEASFPWRPELIFLNPGLDVCLRHCRGRPFEPHKYRTKEEQDKMLAPLREWIAEYYTRQGTMSLEGHRELYERYDGPKREITDLEAIPGSLGPKKNE